ncbi:MAG TPA: hypothetical protein VK821_11835 [Dehalococcoidia bacterium]|nr:hypothetical protein [Dehalococcoidia bacterium]
MVGQGKYPRVPLLASAFGLSAVVVLALLFQPVSSAELANVEQASTYTVVVTQNPLLGSILTDTHGMSLYIRRTDTGGVSTCTDECPNTWPPFLLQSLGAKPVAPGGLQGTLGIIIRDDGSQQVTYNAMPLYYYKLDRAPGDANGVGVAAVWFVATP